MRNAEYGVRKEVRKKTFYIYTLGCKVNQAESEGMRALLLQNGYTPVQRPEDADTVIVHTCAVTLESERKSTKYIRQFLRLPHHPRVIATGCYATLKPSEAAREGASVVISNSQRAKFLKWIEGVKEELPSSPNGKSDSKLQLQVFDDLPQPAPAQRTRAFVKIQDGCSHGCSYCIVPTLRGRERSLPPERVLKILDEMQEQGVPEVVLTGIHLAVYGRDLKPKFSLARLLQAIARRSYSFRVRLSSLEPQDVRGDLIEGVSEGIPSICPHFHLPLQSGSDKILKQMKRGYTFEQFARLVEHLREAIPQVGISTDIIVGFPGETEEDFSATLYALKSLQFVRVHTFPFSVRPGTPASLLPQVPERVKWERQQEVLRWDRWLRRKLTLQQIGAPFEVIPEQPSEEFPGFYQGYTQNYFPALISEAPLGTRVKGKAVDIRDVFLVVNPI